MWSRRIGLLKTWCMELPYCLSQCSGSESTSGKLSRNWYVTYCKIEVLTMHHDLQDTFQKTFKTLSLLHLVKTLSISWVSYMHQVWTRGLIFWVALLCRIWSGMPSAEEEGLGWSPIWHAYRRRPPRSSFAFSKDTFFSPHTWISAKAWNHSILLKFTLDKFSPIVCWIEH